jgi:hypothetical protein
VVGGLVLGPIDVTVGADVDAFVHLPPTESTQSENDSPSASKNKKTVYEELPNRPY